MNHLNEDAIRSVVTEVLQQLRKNGTAPAAPAKTPAVVSKNKMHGVFEDAAQAAAAARTGFEQLKRKGWAGRREVVAIVKSMCTENAERWGTMEFEETKIGRHAHKIEKLQGIQNVLGTEFLTPFGMSGDHGITMEEAAPWGVVGAVTPVTHSVPTIAGNIVNMVAAGNAVVVNAHPGGARCAARAIHEFNEAIRAKLGIENLICAIETPTLESFNEMCRSADVNLLCITGGPAVVKAAMATGKRAICAGPGNPPVVVDECSALDFDKVARDIITGAAYDNNLLCIGEKQVFVVGDAHKPLMEGFRRQGAVLLNAKQLDAIRKAVFTFRPGDGGCSHPVLNRDFVGASAAKLAALAGLKLPESTELLIAETDADDLFVVEEQMMPLVPIIRSRTFEEAVEAARKSEHGYKHSAMVHTMNVSRMTYMGQIMDTTLFIKNGPCVAGLGSGGEGYISFSIATTTGEGITTPRTFTRFRRCTLVDQLNVV